MRDLERRRGERALRFIAVTLVAADPVVALVLALHVAAPLDDGIALDRLSGKGVALGGPVAKVAGLEVEIERLAVAANRQYALRQRGRRDARRRSGFLTSRGGERAKNNEQKSQGAQRHAGGPRRKEERGTDYRITRAENLNPQPENRGRRTR